MTGKAGRDSALSHCHHCHHHRVLSSLSFDHPRLLQRDREMWQCGPFQSGRETQQMLQITNSTKEDLPRSLSWFLHLWCSSVHVTPHKQTHTTSHKYTNPTYYSDLDKFHCSQQFSQYLGTSLHVTYFGCYHLSTFSTLSAYLLLGR